MHEGIVTSLGIVLLCWFILFSPWTNQLIHFWGVLTFAIMMILVLAGHFQPEWTLDIDLRIPTLLGGVGLALAMCGMSWLLSQWGADIISDTDDQMSRLYRLDQGHHPHLISFLLLFFLGASEEIFWRGYIQRVLANRWTPTLGYLVTTLLYALVYLWSFNWLLIISSLCGAAICGALYRCNPCLLSLLIISHGLFDVLILVTWP